jgi:hypothetical protein
MSKRPGRKKQSGVYRKKQLSADARIIYALHKNKLQSKEELIKNSHVTLQTFYRITSFLTELQIIKRVDGMYAFKDFDPLEKIIEDILIRDTRGAHHATSGGIVAEVGKPWSEIQSLTYEIAKKLKLAIFEEPNGVIFYRTAQTPKR